MSEPDGCKQAGSVSVLEPEGKPEAADALPNDSSEALRCCDLEATCDSCPLTDDCSEKDLVEGCKRGYRQAQRRLYETHRDRVMSLMMRITGNEEDAQDLSQQAFIRVMDRIGDFRGEPALGTWIHRVAVNEALQHIRRKKRYQRITETISQQPRWAEPVHEDPSVSLDVHDALDRLPDRLWDRVVLRYERWLDYSEISDALFVKQGTVASGLNRARKQLKTILQAS